MTGKSTGLSDLKITKVVAHAGYKAVLTPSYRDDLGRFLYKISLYKNQVKLDGRSGYLEVELSVTDDAIKNLINLFHISLQNGIISSIQD